MQYATTIEDVQAAVRQQAWVRVRGGGSKPALSAGANLSLGQLTGVLEYEPSEFTFTALAGTPIATLQQLLDEHGQYLPFDPPLGDAGATLGGTVAAGLSGPGRFRYGGVRDFLLGVRLVNSEGELVRGGGRVVKNAAGFDLPKLMVGSLGEFGILVELTCKVFPRPPAWATLRVDLPTLEAALETMTQLATSPLELTCLDLEPSGRLWLRLGGLAEALPERVKRLRQSLPAESQITPLGEAEEPVFWHDVREFAWVPPDHGLVKVPLTPQQISVMDQHLASLPVPVVRRYSLGGNVAWLAWPASLPASHLEAILQTLDQPALAVNGTWADPRLGKRPGGFFVRRLIDVFDPERKFQRDGQSPAA
jgi:glycolate oxidase FAD binding subunit